MSWQEWLGSLMVLIGLGGGIILLTEVLCGLLDLPRVRASRDEYDEVQP